MGCEFELGKEKWLRQNNQLRPRHSETSGTQSGIPLFTLLDIFHLADFTFQIAPERRVTGSSSAIPKTSRTIAAAGEPQDQVMRIRSLTKGDVKENLISLRQIECLNNYVNICC